METGIDQSTSRLFFIAVTKEIFMKFKGYMSMDKWFSSLKAATPLANTGFGRLLCWHPNTVFLSYYYYYSSQILSGLVLRDASTESNDIWQQVRCRCLVVHSRSKIFKMAPVAMETETL